jgi:HNH endonuclease
MSRQIQYEINENSCWECISHSPNSDGYSIVFINGKYEKLHRYIFRKYKLSGNEIPEGKLVCHTCDNRRCINPDHLYLGTSADNSKDKMERGRFKPNYGVNNGRCILSESDVFTIIDWYLSGFKNQYELAKIFEVSRSAIKHIVNNRNWKHIT